MSSWARPGVKCVCINSAWKRGALPLWKWLALRYCGLPFVGGVYTIVGVTRHDASGVTGLILKGYPGVVFCVWQFRPLVPAPTLEEDLARFTPLLDLDMPIADDADRPEVPA